MKEVDQNIPFGGLVEYGNFFLDYFFANSKNFRLNAIQGLCWICEFYCQKGPGFCYVAPSPPSSCFLGHKTGLLSAYMLKYLVHQYMRWSIVNNLNLKK